MCGLISQNTSGTPRLNCRIRIYWCSFSWRGDFVCLGPEGECVPLRNTALCMAITIKLDGVIERKKTQWFFFAFHFPDDVIKWKKASGWKVYCFMAHWFPLYCTAPYSSRFGWLRRMSKLLNMGIGPHAGHGPSSGGKGARGGGEGGWAVDDLVPILCASLPFDPHPTTSPFALPQFYPFRRIFRTV